MRLRLKLLRIIMRNCKPLFFIPIIIAYCLLPGVSAIKYFYVDPSEARSTFIYMAQVFIPLCGLLWPMGYLHVWVEGDGCEALRACTKYHKTCVGELLLLCSAYLLMVFPTIAFAVIMFHLSWLEYMRLALQFSIIINFLYFMIMLLKNVTIGCIPVVAYLLLCLYISGSADFADTGMCILWRFGQSPSTIIRCRLVRYSVFSAIVRLIFSWSPLEHPLLYYRASK